MQLTVPEQEFEPKEVPETEDTFPTYKLIAVPHLRRKTVISSFYR
jgi:hypothetical protein